MAPKTQISKLRLAHLDFHGNFNSKSDLISSLFLFEQWNVDFLMYEDDNELGSDYVDIVDLVDLQDLVAVDLNCLACM